MKEAPRVLVVDVDESIREFVGLALADEGYEVVTAHHGAAALERIAQLPPHLILLDVRMPIMDGWAFVRAYREQPGPHAPIIILTAAREVAERRVQMDAEAQLAKPFDLNELLALVDQLTHHA
ncbi:MAG: response regulator transcription factor [Chloroflexi bacterium]|nr:response regulator transcription factor [Chloroflexota bacterium]